MLFKDERFGMFIHWGLYSVNGWHEQEQWRRNVPKGEYVKLAESFNPVNFDIDRWLDLAKSAGMQYLCFTAKHHDGFCMWDTKYTDYNIMNTPYKKDILKLVAKGCERHGIKLAIYYSVPDWHHKNSVNFGGNHQLSRPNPGDCPDEEKYKQYVKNQMSELLTNYGRIDALFWDIKPYNRDDSVNEFVRALQPRILINDRGYSPGDYSTPEREAPKGRGYRTLTEACWSVGAQSWGYRENEDYLSCKYITDGIDGVMSRGGNFLLNVGPKPDGTICGEAASIIKTVGEWYNRVKESYMYADTVEQDVLPYIITKRENSLYIHLGAILKSRGLSLKPISVVPDKITVLNGGETLKGEVSYLPSHFYAGQLCCEQYLHISGIPAEKYANENIVIKLEFKDISPVLKMLSEAKRTEIIL